MSDECQKHTVRLDASLNFKASEGHRLVDIDRARINHLKSRFQTENFDHHDFSELKTAPVISSFPITNAAVTFTTSVGIGEPPTPHNLLIDTGSSNTWIGAHTAFTTTSTSKKTRDTFAVRYGSGSVAGTEYLDTVTLSDQLVIPSQSIGVANAGGAIGFDGVDGILGVGPVGLTVGTLKPDRAQPIPTVTDNLFANGRIPVNALGVYFEPSVGESSVSGELTFGGADETKITGEITYVPVTDIAPASHYWGVTQSLNYGDKEILPSTGGIVDTGTTLIYIASEAFQKYLSATGGALDKATKLVKIPNENVSDMQSLFFNVGGASLELIANAQIWPRSLNQYMGGEEGATYSVIADIGTVSGVGMDFISGYAFLQRYYTVYDTTNSQVGFAETAFTFAETN